MKAAIVLQCTRGLLAASLDPLSAPCYLKHRINPKENLTAHS